MAGVIELAPISPLTERQQALLEALLPVVALNLEILSGNIRTRQLLEQTRQQSEALAAVEERSRLILESVGEAIFGLTADGLMSFVNPAGARLLGYKPEELIGHPMHGADSLRASGWNLIPTRRMPDVPDDQGWAAAQRL